MSAAHLRVLLLALLCATLTGCASTPVAPAPVPCVAEPPPPPAPAPPPKTSRLIDLMLDYDVLSQQPAADLEKTYRTAAQAFSQTGSDASRVKLALLLALPDTSFHDTAAALNLLNNWPKPADAAPAALRSFAHLLSVLLTQQQRSATSVNDLAQKLHESQKSVETLQSKINAIKDMEKNPTNKP